MGTKPVIKEDTNIYSILRDDIVELRLELSMFLNIKDIRGLYDMGHSFGRGALLQLGQEDPTAVLPHRRNTISKSDLDRINNERFAHRSTEESVLRNSIGMFSPSAIPRMGNCVLEQKEQYRAKNIRRLFDADEGFHVLFFSEIFRDYCLSVIEREYNNYRRIRLLTLTASGSFMKDSTEEHESMIRTAPIGNLDKLMFRSPPHTDRYRAQERWLLKRFPDLFTQSDKESEGMRKSPADLASDFLLSIRFRGL